LAGAYVLHERLRATAELNTLAGQIFCQITAGTIPLTARYQSGVPGIDEQSDERRIETAFLEQLSKVRDDELGRGQTLIGPHRDDLLLGVGEMDVGTYGSRGQQRSATLALKLGEAALMRNRSGDAPVLLLDDLLSELDAERRQHLLATINQPDQQTLVTATGLEEFDAAFLQRARKIRVEGAKLYF
jgi:DNA replication and repair protein RecF